MMHFGKWIILSLILLFLSGCYRFCEDFNYDIIQWMPYDEFEQFAVSNQDSTLTLTVNFRQITHTEKFPRLADCACLNTYDVKLLTGSLNILVSFQESRNPTYSIIEINNNEFVDFVQHWDELVINGREYTELIEFSNQDRPEHETYYRIIIARNYGIVSIQVDDDEWFLVDDTDREIEPTGIKKNITQC